MKAPSFWNKPNKTFSAKLLSPLGDLYGHFTVKRANQPATYKASVPVICIGNVALGGTGKTPTVQAIGRYLKNQGKSPFVLSRGYSGKVTGPLLVGREMAEEVGDEPLMLSNYMPVVVSQDRIKGADVCVAHGADMILMDDGFQNPHLAKDVSLIVIDGAVGHGNGCLFPAGPLREPVREGLKRAQAVLIIDKDETGCLEAIQKEFPDMKILQAQLRPENQSLDPDEKYLAFAGIGRPEKFFKTLAEQSFNVVETRSFADHHLFHESELRALKDAALIQGAKLICTEKDWVRLPPKWQSEVIPFKITLEWQDEDLIKAILSPLLSA